MQASVLPGRGGAGAHPAGTLGGAGSGKEEVQSLCPVCQARLSMMSQPQCLKVWMSLWRLTEGLEGPLCVRQLVLQLQRWIHMTFL